MKFAPTASSKCNIAIIYTSSVLFSDCQTVFWPINVIYCDRRMDHIHTHNGITGCLYLNITADVSCIPSAKETYQLLKQLICIYKCELKLYHAKRNVYTEQMKKCCRPLCSFKMDWAEVENCPKLWKLIISFWKLHFHCILLKTRDTFWLIISKQFRNHRSMAGKEVWLTCM